MNTRIDKFERLGAALETAAKLTHELGLELLPALLNMARLEFLNELAADGNQPIGTQSRGNSSSLHNLN